MAQVEYIENNAVIRVLLGVPQRHKHLRLAIKLANGRVLLFSEATVANIVRAYVTVKTHPQVRAVELVGMSLKERKPEYAKYQLLETRRDPNEIESELAKLLELAKPVHRQI